MTQPLRKVHLRIWFALAIALPLLLATAVWMRRDPTPVNPNLSWDQVR